VFIAIIICYLTNHNINAQSICDTTGEPFVYTEILPTCNITAEELEFILNQNIQVKDYNIENDKIIKLSLTINCSGEDFGFKVLNFENELFNKKFIDCIQNNTNWTPAYFISRKGQREYKKAVDFSLVLTFKILNGHIIYLDDKITTYRKNNYFIKREKPIKKSKNR